MRLRREESTAGAAADRLAVRVLVYQAWLEIRYLAGPARRQTPDATVDAD